MPSPMPSCPSPLPDDPLWRLTRLALDAAERGDWPSVRIYYEERGRLLRESPVCVATARLSAADESIAGRIALAQAAIGQLQSEVAETQRRLASVSDRIRGRSGIGVNLNRQS